MVNKNKKSQTGSNFTQLAKQSGTLLMTAAVTLGMIELPNHFNRRVVVPNQPSFAFVGENQELNNTQRRESEETAPHYVSYSEAQRTPSRSGKY